MFMPDLAFKLLSSFSIEPIKAMESTITPSFTPLEAALSKKRLLMRLFLIRATQAEILLEPISNAQI
jgi:hypothetical protein